MSAITIKDLHVNQGMDSQAMTSIRGAGAPWMSGEFKAYWEGAKETALNYVQSTNNFYAQQMVNKSQTISLSNSGNSASVNAVMVSAVASA